MNEIATLWNDKKITPDELSDLIKILRRCQIVEGPSDFQSFFEDSVQSPLLSSFFPLVSVKGIKELSPSSFAKGLKHFLDVPWLFQEKEVLQYEISTAKSYNSVVSLSARVEAWFERGIREGTHEIRVALLRNPSNIQIS